MFYLILYIPDSLIPTGNIKIIEMFYIFLILSLPNLVGNFTLIEHLTLNQRRLKCSIATCGSCRPHRTVLTSLMKVYREGKWRRSLCVWRGEPAEAEGCAVRVGGTWVSVTWWWHQALHLHTFVSLCTLVIPFSIQRIAELQLLSSSVQQ